MAIYKPPDPHDMLRCLSCDWRGMVALAICEKDSLIRCPKCGKAPCALVAGPDNPEADQPAAKGKAAETLPQLSEKLAKASRAFAKAFAKSVAKRMEDHPIRFEKRFDPEDEIQQYDKAVNDLLGTAKSVHIFAAGMDGWLSLSVDQGEHPKQRTDRVDITTAGGPKQYISGLASVSGTLANLEADSLNGREFSIELYNADGWKIASFKAIGSLGGKGGLVYRSNGAVELNWPDHPAADQPIIVEGE